MRFVDRNRELARLTRAMAAPAGGMVCVWGRRRLGKSRLLREATAGRPSAFVVGDDRDAPLQRAAVAREIGRLLPGFDSVAYPTWDALLERFWRDAPAGTVLVLDELPAMVARSPELPGVLQRLLDGQEADGRYLALYGSSQRMMHGLVLDATAPLLGRAREILRIEPMAPRWLGEALGLSSPVDVLRRFAVFGGVPRYWELMAPFADLETAATDLVLDPVGVLHDEPERLLLDDLRETARAASILALIGQGCARLSEIAGRLGQPSTSLTRPMERLISLGLVPRETPFGVPAKDSKRSLYRIADPLLAFWYRFVEPNRSLLAAGALDAVAADVWRDFPLHLGPTWEALVRWRVPRAPIRGARWKPASRWWGDGVDGRPLELDAVAESADRRDTVLLVEARLQVSPPEVPGLLAALRDKASRCPTIVGRRCEAYLWVLADAPGVPGVLGAAEVLEAE
ncbi:ATP-binding protein [Myxococcota bacterium]|nr:ATP-binding protein [Myxococcota bacterium]